MTQFIKLIFDMSLNILHLFNKVSATQTALIKRIDALENRRHVEIEPELPVHNGVKVSEDLQDSLHDAVQRIDFLENANRQLKQQMSEFKDIANTIAAHRTSMNEAVSSFSTEKNTQAKLNKEVAEMIQSALKKIDGVEFRQRDVESRQKDRDMMIQKSLVKNEEEVSSIDDKLLSMELELEKGISKANEMKNSIAGNFNESITKIQSDLSEGLSRLEDQIKAINTTQTKINIDAKMHESYIAKHDEVEKKLKELEKRMETNENNRKSKESKENNDINKPSNQRTSNGPKPSPLDLTEVDLKALNALNGKSASNEINSNKQSIEHMLDQIEKSNEDSKLGEVSVTIDTSDGLHLSTDSSVSNRVPHMSNEKPNEVPHLTLSNNEAQQQGSINTSIDISDISEKSLDNIRHSTNAPSDPPVKRTRKKEMRKKW